MPKRRRACDSCYRRKIHCDKALPRCDWCKHHNSPCKYESRDSAMREEPPRHLSGQDLASGIRRIELALELIQQGSASRRLQITEQQALKPLATSSHARSSPLKDFDSWPHSLPHDFNPGGRLDFAGCHVADISSFNGTPFFSKAGCDWIRSRTGQEPSLHKLYDSGRPWQHRSPPTPCVDSFTQSTPDLDLPSRKTVERFVSLAYPSRFNHLFPIIDEVLFQDFLDSAYAKVDRSSPSLESISAKCFLFSFLSLVSRIQTEWGSTPPVDGKTFLAKAHSLMPHVLSQVNVMTLYTVLMMCANYLTSGDLQQGIIFHSYTCRILFALRLHFHAETVPQDPFYDSRSDQRRDRMRRLFWLVYWLDKELCLRTGQPPSIDDSYCDLTLSESSLGAEDRAGASGSSSNEPSTLSLSFPGDLQLAVIKSKVCKSLYSASALKKRGADLLRDIRELDDELEAWRLRIPPADRPVLSIFSQNAPSFEPHDRQLATIRRVFTQFEYLFLIAAIHGASGRCNSFVDGNNGDLKGISSSIAISVQASRSSLNFLRTSATVINEENFWLFIFHPLSAILTLFCNVLLDPLNSLSRDDVQLITSIPRLLTSSQSQPMVSQDELYLKRLDVLVAELARLAHCAIEKAST